MVLHSAVRFCPIFSSSLLCLVFAACVLLMRGGGRACERRTWGAVRTGAAPTWCHESGSAQGAPPAAGGGGRAPGEDLAPARAAPPSRQGPQISDVDMCHQRADWPAGYCNFDPIPGQACGDCTVGAAAAAHLRVPGACRGLARGAGRWSPGDVGVPLRRGSGVKGVRARRCLWWAALGPAARRPPRARLRACMQAGRHANVTRVRCCFPGCPRRRQARAPQCTLG